MKAQKQIEYYIQDNTFNIVDAAIIIKNLSECDRDIPNISVNTSKCTTSSYPKFLQFLSGDVEKGDYVEVLHSNYETIKKGDIYKVSTIQPNTGVYLHNENTSTSLFFPELWITKYIPKPGDFIVLEDKNINNIIHIDNIDSFNIYSSYALKNDTVYKEYEYNINIRKFRPATIRERDFLISRVQKEYNQTFNIALGIWKNYKFIPKIHDVYYTITSAMEIKKDTNYNSILNEYRITNNNVFKTQELAQIALNKIKQILKDCKHE